LPLTISQIPYSSNPFQKVLTLSDVCVIFSGDPAKDVMKDALQDLMVMGQHVRGTFDKAVADFKSNMPAEQMDVDSNQQ
jgi:hypothetical protein